MIMGIGVGAACPVLLSAIGTNKFGKRTALVYLVNDMCAMILGTILFYSANALLHFDFLNMSMSPVSIALLNTVYRVCAMLILLPFVKVIEKIVTFLVPGKEEEDDEDEDFELLEERFLAYPAIAINQCHRSIVMMAKSCRKNLFRSLALYGDYSEKTFNKIKNREKKVDKYEDKIEDYLISLTENIDRDPVSMFPNIFIVSAISSALAIMPIISPRSIKNFTKRMSIFLPKPNMRFPS